MLLNKEYLLTFYSYQIIKKFHETFFTFLEAIQEAEADAVTHGGCGTIINYWEWQFKMVAEDSDVVLRFVHLSHDKWTNANFET